MTALAVAVGLAACGAGSAARLTSSATTLPGEGSTIAPSPPAPPSTTGEQGRPATVAEIAAVGSRAPSGGATSAQRAAVAMAAFGGALYQQLKSSDRDANLVVSPVSIATVFSMIIPGARGATGEQLSKVFGVSGSDADQQSVNSLLQELRSRNRSADPGTNLQVTLRLANDLWTQAGFPVEPPFLQRLGASYGAGMHQANFADAAAVEQARQQINALVSQTTNGRIPELFDPGMLDSSTRVALVNALHLLGSWAVPFLENETDSNTFTRRGGTTVWVPFMHADAGDYAAGSGWQAVTLPLYGKQLSVVFILPDVGRFDEIESSLGSTLLNQTRQHQVPAPGVRLALPKFKLDTSLELTAALKQLGVKDAFGAAGFNGISNGAGLFINVVAHRTFIAVDEHGIEAAAATGVGMAVAGHTTVIDVRFDRPFLLAVIDEPTGAPLFLGRVTDPSA